MYQEGGGGVHRQDAAEYLNGIVAEWLDTHSRDKNFFLFLHTYMVHDYLPPEELATAFNSNPESLATYDRKALQRIQRKCHAEKELRSARCKSW